MPGFLERNLLRAVRAIPVIGPTSAAILEQSGQGDPLTGGTATGMLPPILPGLDPRFEDSGVATGKQSRLVLRAKRAAAKQLASMGLPSPTQLDLGITPVRGLPVGGLSVPGQNLQLANVLPLSFGTAMVRPPRGYVTVRVNNQNVFMLRKIAIANKMWKPAKKPPMSVRDWNCILGANRVVKKLKAIEMKVKRVANFRAPVRKAPLIAPHPHRVTLPANVGTSH